MTKSSIQAYQYPKNPNKGFSLSREEDTILGGYLKAINIIREKYFFIKSKGALYIRTIIDYRASVIAGGEINVTANEQTESALTDWFDTEAIYNKTVAYAQLAEREGRLALAIYKKGDSIGVRALPYHEYKYKLLYDKYDEVSGLEYQSSEGLIKIMKPYLVYMQYAGQDEYSGESMPPPKVAYCINDIDKMDEEMLRWSNINHFFADPTTHFDTKDISFFEKLKQLVVGKMSNAVPESGNGINDEQELRSWKVGEGIVTVNTTLDYKQSEMRGIESIDRNIQVRAQRVSFITGVPIFIIYPELMSNRATADQIAAETNNATVIERMKHQDLWQSVCESFCITSNILFGTSFSFEDLYVTLPQISSQQLQLLINTTAPLVGSGIMSKQTFRELLPNINSVQEAERIEQESSNSMSSISNSILGAE